MYHAIVKTHGNPVLYGVGAGPGDPEMLTLKAINCIRAADVLCFPVAPKESCRAYQIAERAVPEIREKECHFFDFPMIRDKEELNRTHEEAWRKIRDRLMEGRQVAFLTIGETAVYSSFTYMASRARRDGFRVETVNGITSFQAVAASLGIPLCEGNEELHIITGQSDMEQSLSLPGTKVIMKCGRRLPAIKAILRQQERERGIRVYAVTDCGLDNERKYFGADEIPEEENYMTTLIVKEPEQ